MDTEHTGDARGRINDRVCSPLRLPAATARVARQVELYAQHDAQGWFDDAARVAAESALLRGLWHACEDAEAAAFEAVGDWASLRAMSEGRSSPRCLPSCHPSFAIELDEP